MIKNRPISDEELMAPLLKVPRGKTMTKKQRDFAKAVANGATGVEAYRKAYDVTGSINTQKTEAWRLKQNPYIAQTIEAMQRAKELTDSLSASQIRSFITKELLAHAQNEELKASDRLNALKLLGTLSDVSAYTHRSESIQVKASVDIKEQLMEKLKLIGASSTPQADSAKVASDSGDADSLLQELRDDPDVIDGQLIERGREFDSPEASSSELEADSELNAPKA